jgi:branched-chain amino acid transport system ATP-binding protein
LVVVDHDLRLIMKLCDRIQVLDQGRTIGKGTPRQIAEDPIVVEAYLGGPSSKTA